MDLNNIKQIISSAMRESGDILIHEFETFNRADVTIKADHSIVTRFDLLSEKIIIKTIRENFPDHNILSEEKGGEVNTSDYLWVIDPIDGTTNFTMHNPLWAISIALFYKNDPVLALVYSPSADEMYTAIKGEGAYLNGEPVKVSQIAEGKIVNAFCHGGDQESKKRAVKYYSYQILNNSDCRQFGSASVELAYVSAGRMETMVIPGAHVWDVAAGVLLIREAGGRVTDFVGNEWNLQSKDMSASNGLIHDSLLEILSQI